MSYGTIEDSWTHGANACLLSAKEEGLQCLTGTSFISAGHKGVVCLGLGGFPGCRTFIAKTREVPGKPGQFITLARGLAHRRTWSIPGPHSTVVPQRPPYISRCPLEVETVPGESRLGVGAPGWGKGWQDHG